MWITTAEPRVPPAPVLRLASVTTARQIGVENALALAASVGFERVELESSDLPGDPARRARLPALLRELGLRVAAVSVPVAELLEGDLMDLCDRCAELDCHRLGVAVDPAAEAPEAVCLGRLLDGVGYRLAGRSSSLSVRASAPREGPGPDTFAPLLAQLSQACVGLELEAAGQGPDAGLERATRWRPRVRALALDDLELVEAPRGRWADDASLGSRTLHWLGAARTVELVIRHSPSAPDEGETLSQARSRWRREVERARGEPFEPCGASKTLYSRISICQSEVAHVEEGHPGGTDHA